MTEIESLKEKLLKLYLKAMAQQLEAVLREAQEKTSRWSNPFIAWPKWSSKDAGKAL